MLYRWIDAKNADKTPNSTPIGDALCVVIRSNNIKHHTNKFDPGFTELCRHYRISFFVLLPCPAIRAMLNPKPRVMATYGIELDAKALPDNCP